MKIIYKISYVFIAFMMIAGRSKCQILIEPQLPSQGVIQQSQLWNILVINNEVNVSRAVLRITFQEEKSGNKIFAGTSGDLLLPKGACQITSTSAGAIHYDYFSGNAGAMNGGLLPVGRFVVCYDLIPSDNKLSAPGQECMPLTVEPFSPPQLVFPEDKDSVTTVYPVLNWLAPIPVNMFSDLNYKLIISEVTNGQAPAVAIQRNPLLFVQDQIRQTSYVYPSSYVALQPGKTYAWQILAQNGLTYSQATDVWSFTIRKDSVVIPFDNASYPHLQNGIGTLSYSVSERIKFSYDNESDDSVVNIRLMSHTGSTVQMLNELPVSLKRGMNFIDLNLNDFKKLQESQEYILELTNGRKENWDLRFKYEPMKQ